MSRIKKTFEEANGPLLNVYFTAGYPELESTIPNVKALEEGGADLIELGMPYSDPLADGETIQQSSSVAINNGMSIETLFDQLTDVRKDVGLPILLMGYLNPIMQFGSKEFCEKCKEVGVDGLIIPDLPLELFDAEFSDLFKSNDLDFVFLITPETPDDRVKEIDERTTGFIYMVSSSSTTGKSGELSQEQIAYFERIENMKLQNPRMIGFGISDSHTFKQATSHAEGAIIGSAFIKQLAEDASEGSIKNFVKKVKS